MLYFEDALWIRENFWKNFIGTFYFVTGFFGIAFHLILISILPEISNFISRPSTVILSAQFTACILQLFVVFIPVPAMIAVNKPYFLNEVIINVPPFLLVMSQSFAFTFMLILVIYRNFRNQSDRFAQLIFTNHFLIGLIITAFSASFAFAVNICAHTIIRRFSPPDLTWTIQNFEITAFKILAVFITIPCIIVYILAFACLIYQKIYEKEDEQENENSEDHPTESAVSTVSHLIFDTLFILLVYFGGVLVSEQPLISVSYIFLTAYWPVITVLSTDIHIRSALIYRLRGIFQPHLTMSPIVIRSNKKEPGKSMKF